MTEGDQYYRALLSRDSRFDGRFFVGVRTTGVYCRPICPAPKPRPRNVEFFPSAAAAEGAGYRACRRCRPEKAPGSPAWLGTSTTIERALRLIEDGALDGEGVESLASRLGMGARQLRRLFEHHLGASPSAVAKTRRVHFARKLIDETSLPMTDVATSAGFGSVRRFNDAVQRAFGDSPTNLRRGSRGAGSRRRNASSNGTDAEESKGRLVLRLPYRPPLNWEALLDFVRPRCIPGVERVDGPVYRRTIRVNGDEGVLAVRDDPRAGGVVMAVPMPVSKRLLGVVERVRRIFDLSADPHLIGSHLRGDPVLSPILQTCPGVRVPGGWDAFELSVRAVLGQQVTVRGATTLTGRLVRAFGTPVDRPLDDGLTHHFPRPEALVEADLASIGLPRARAETIRALAGAVSDGGLCLDGGTGLNESLDRLQSIPGIGAWTAHYIAMRALREPDAFPAGDLGLRRALAEGGPLLSAGRTERRAESWRPWRAYAAMLLWRRGTDATPRRNP